MIKLQGTIQKQKILRTEKYYPQAETLHAEEQR